MRRVLRGTNPYTVLPLLRKIERGKQASFILGGVVDRSPGKWYGPSVQLGG